MFNEQTIKKIEDDLDMLYGEQGKDLSEPEWEKRELQILEEMRKILEDEAPDPDVMAARPKTNNIIYEAGSLPYVYVLEGEEAKRHLREQDEMWCTHCGSIFPAGWMKADFMGNFASCGARNECDACGLGVDIHRADSEMALNVMIQNRTPPSKARRNGYLEKQKLDV